MNNIASLSHSRLLLNTAFLPCEGSVVTAMADISDLASSEVAIMERMGIWLVKKRDCLSGTIPPPDTSPLMPGKTLPYHCLKSAPVPSRRVRKHEQSKRQIRLSCRPWPRMAHWVSHSGPIPIWEVAHRCTMWHHPNPVTRYKTAQNGTEWHRKQKNP